MDKNLFFFIDRASKEDLKELLVILEGKKCITLIDFISSSVSSTQHSP